ncbi:MAG: tRNA (guanosine(37)-N1)-methyltransferase TrmD [Acidobacteria bacterium]|nr:tRNA (guanosine(37)-N1)-methyltransferase TrmD [Acidobacteriota bacterium]
MRFDVITIFPTMVEAGLAEGVVGRARGRGLLDVVVHNLRDYTTDRHHVVDDVPFGGGPGMVMKPEPFWAALAQISAEGPPPDAVLLMSPAGRRLDEAGVRRFAGCRHVVVLCGRYEGIDERVRTRWVTDEVSIGDYVLSGGELPALVLIDAVARRVPGVVGDEQSVEEDSFARGVLDYPHYTRPAVWDGMAVPEVLTSGHHQAIRQWRRYEALRRTFERRPDLLETAALDDDERTWLRAWQTQGNIGQ